MLIGSLPTRAYFKKLVLRLKTESYAYMRNKLKVFIDAIPRTFWSLD